MYCEYIHTGPARSPGSPAANREGRLKSREELARKVEVLGERIVTLSVAVLRLGSSLDLATVLQGGRRQCLHAHQRALQPDRHRRRGGRVRHLRAHARRAPRPRRVVRRLAAVRESSRPAGLVPPHRPVERVQDFIDGIP